MNNLENETPVSESQPEQKESSLIENVVNAVNPIDVVEILLETGKIVVDSGKDIISNIADSIDF